MDDETFEQKFEAAIPVLVLILLIIGIIALNPGILAGVPVIGQYFQGSATHVLIITDDMNEVQVWQNVLGSDMARRVFGNPINVEGIMGSQTENVITTVDALNQKGYDIIILTSKHIPVSVQLILKQWAANGGKMYIAGIGGINDNGRWGELSDVVPVQCGSEGVCSNVIKPVYGATIYINQGQYENPLAKELGNGVPLVSGNESINVAMVSPKETGWILFIGGWDSPDKIEAGKMGNVYPFITESAQLTGGKVFYISFDPATENIGENMRQKLMINTIAYVLGVPGYAG